MSGGIENSKQFIGISVRKPYSEEYSPVGLSWPDTEGGISEAHGHADALAEKLNVPRHAIRVARYVTTTQMVEPEVAKPEPKKQPKSPTASARAPKSPKSKPTPVAKPAKAAPALDEVTVTKGGKSSTYKLGK